MPKFTHGFPRPACYYLYGILDVFSRYVAGWMLAHSETAPLARQLIAETLAKQGIVPNQMSIHAGRGAVMTSKPVAFPLADSRPDQDA